MWNNEESRAVQTYFRCNIKHQLLPGKKKIEESMEEYPILKSRPWRQIKDQIRAQINRNKNLLQKITC